MPSESFVIQQRIDSSARAWRCCNNLCRLMVGDWFAGLIFLSASGSNVSVVLSSFLFPGVNSA